MRSIGGWRTVRAAAALWSALVCVPVVAQIEPRSALEPPDLLEMVGHPGKAFPGETGGWELTLGDRYKNRTFHFHLFRMRILNSGRLPMDILQAVEPYRPNFFLFPQQPAQMEAIETAAAPRDQLTITGYRRRGSRNLLLTKVEIAPLSTPAAKDPTAP